mgnify:CR=1 FL=1
MDWFPDSMTQADRFHIYEHAFKEPKASFEEWSRQTARKDPRFAYAWLSMDFHLPNDLVNVLKRTFRPPRFNNNNQRLEESVQAEDIEENANQAQEVQEEPEEGSKKAASLTALATYMETRKSSTTVIQPKQEVDNKRKLQAEAYEYLKKLKVKLESKSEAKKLKTEPA